MCSDMYLVVSSPTIDYLKDKDWRAMNASAH